MSPPAPLDRILETCLYAADLPAARAFYADVLRLEIVLEQHGRHIFFRCGSGMLLVFDPAATADPAGRSPAHGAHGPGHVAFAVEAPDLDAWRDHLIGAGIAIEADVTWPHGARSLYIRDPAGNSLEFASPDMWPATV